MPSTVPCATVVVVEGSVRTSLLQPRTPVSLSLSHVSPKPLNPSLSHFRLHETLSSPSPKINTNCLLKRPGSPKRRAGTQLQYQIFGPVYGLLSHGGGVIARSHQYTLGFRVSTPTTSARAGQGSRGLKLGSRVAGCFGFRRAHGLQVCDVGPGLKLLRQGPTSQSRVTDPKQSATLNPKP